MRRGAARAAAAAVLGGVLLAACSGSPSGSTTGSPSRASSGAGGSSTGAAGSPSTPGDTSSGAPGGGTAAPSTTAQPTDAAFAALERTYGARLAVVVRDTGSPREVTYRADERFPFASTLKVVTAGLLLRGLTDTQLDAVVHYSPAQVLAYAPVTSQHVATGLSLRALVAASVQQSDNTAANLVMLQLGGPTAVQDALRSLGDTVTNVDRTEPDLNTATPGDDRDTSTASVLADDLRGFTVTELLSPDRRQLLLDLMTASTTGTTLIRAGTPAGWRVADKSGSADHGTRNDIALVTPPGRAPLVVVVLSERTDPARASDDGLIAAATRAALTALG